VTEMKDGLPVLPMRPTPRIVCWVILDVIAGKPIYWLFDPEQPGSLREMANQ